MADKAYYYGVGRRKEATAQARLLRGKGQMTVNAKTAEVYFGHTSLVENLLAPLLLIGKANEFDVTVITRGGGKASQSDAARLALAKALVVMDPELRPTLKKAGLVMRDARIKERKKPGLKRARKALQFTKR